MPLLRATRPHMLNFTAGDAALRQTALTGLSLMCIGETLPLEIPPWLMKRPSPRQAAGKAERLKTQLILSQTQAVDGNPDHPIQRKEQFYRDLEIAKVSSTAIKD